MPLLVVQNGTAGVGRQFSGRATLEEAACRKLPFVDASFQLNPRGQSRTGRSQSGGHDNALPYGGQRGNSDEGAVSVPKKMTIGYFRQDVEEIQAVRSSMKRSHRLVRISGRGW